LSEIVNITHLKRYKQAFVTSSIIKCVTKLTTRCKKTSR
jgi:hypothetical protein